MSFTQTLKFANTGNPHIYMTIPQDIYDYISHLACHFIYTALESVEKTETKHKLHLILNSCISSCDSFDCVLNQ